MMPAMIATRVPTIPIPMAIKSTGSAFVPRPDPPPIPELLHAQISAGITQPNTARAPPITTQTIGAREGEVTVTG